MIRILSKAIGGFLTILMMATIFMPPTADEAALLGSDVAQFDLVQMRLVRAMMNVAPDATVARYAAATDLPPEQIRAHLEAKANGEPLVSAGEVTDPNTQTRAGGAKFVTAH